MQKGMTPAPIQALILSFAPGGFAELAIVAYSLGIDTTFVVGHQIARYLFITFAAPVAFRVIHGADTSQ